MSAYSNNNNNNDTYIAQIRKMQQMRYALWCKDNKLCYWREIARRSLMKKVYAALKSVEITRIVQVWDFWLSFTTW